MIDLNKLTPREAEIFHMLCKGHETKEMAFELGISPKTVWTHRTTLFRKFNVHSLAELMRAVCYAETQNYE